MNKWKFFLITAVIAGSLFAVHPTFDKLLFRNQAEIVAKVKAKMEEVQAGMESLEGMNLFLAQPNENRIRILVEEDYEIPFENPVLEAILENSFEFVRDEDGSYFVPKDPDEDLILARFSERLNRMAGNIRKIQEITLAPDATGIVFQLEEGGRIAKATEPVKSLIGEDFDWFYDKAGDRYLSSPNESDFLINLGLDLQGGTYLEVGIDTDKVLAQIIGELRFQLEDALIEMDVSFDDVAVEGQSAVRIEFGADVDEFDPEGEPFASYTLNYDVNVGSESVLVEIPFEEMALIRNSAIEQAIQTLRSRIDELGVREPSIQRKGDEAIIIQLPGETDPARARDILTQTAALEFRFVMENNTPLNPGEGLVLVEETLDPVSKEVVFTQQYVVEPNVSMKGNAISDARLNFSQFGAPEILLNLNSAGSDLFADITRQNVGRQLAIILDGKIKSAPVIQVPITTGQAVISGVFSPAEAADLALVLRSGELAAPLTVNEEKTVGASLGEDSINDSLKSFIIGFALLLALIVTYYRIPGVMSTIALLVNVLMILAVLAYFGATLTLPGIAGIILTIGMAVDSNVLIFERIKEELKRQTDAMKSVKIGFDRAFVTILDANFTTFLAGVVLLQFGTGSIKGFAVTLTIGILTSMFSSVFFTRFLFETFYFSSRKRRAEAKVSF